MKIRSDYDKNWSIKSVTQQKHFQQSKTEVSCTHYTEQAEDIPSCIKTGPTMI